MKHTIPIQTGNMTQETWKTLTVAQQLGHIGSEFSMYALLLKKEALIDARKSLTIVSNLLEFTILDTRWANHLNELTRFRKLLNDTTSEEYVHQLAVEKLQTYLLSFALLARK